MTPSFGFGDRIGLATPGHVAAMHMYGKTLAPIFAQQSIREMTRTARTPRQVMSDATWGAFRAGWQGPVGADADHLKTAADVDQMAEAGFTFFTIDPSDHVDQQADDYSNTEVEEKFQAMLRDNVPGSRDVLGLYADKSFDLGADQIALEASRTVEYLMGIAWRNPVRWPIFLPYVFLYLGTLMFYWWPLGRIRKPLWYAYAVLFAASTVLNILSHK